MNHSLCTIEDLTPQQPRAFVAGNQKILLVKTDAGIFATENMCPHQSRPIDTGLVTGDTLRCIYHGVTISLIDGTLRDTAGFLNLPGARTFQVTVCGNNVSVEIPD